MNGLSGTGDGFGLSLSGMRRTGLFGLMALAGLALSACSNPLSSSRDEPAPVIAPPPPPPSAAAPAPDAALDQLLLRENGTPAGKLGLPEPGVTRVALLVPLSGQHQVAGQALLAGAQMALFEAGIDRVELTSYDTKGTTDGAHDATADALNDGAKIILGPLLAPNVSAAAELARPRNVPIVAFSNSEQVAGNGVFLIGFAPYDQIHRILGHAQAEGRRRLAVIVPRDAYGDAVLADTTQAANTLGMEVVRRLSYAGSPTEWTGMVKDFADFDARARALAQERANLKARGDEAALAALRRLETAETLGDPPYDAVLIAATDPVALKSLSGLLAFYDVDRPAVRLLGMELWDALGRLNDEATLIGARYPARPLVDRRAFAERYAALYNSQPGRIASLGYDAAALAVIASQNADPATPLAQAITNPYGFLGVDGLFRFDPVSGLAERGLDVLEVTPRGPVVIDPAPTSFTPPPAIAPAS